MKRICCLLFIISSFWNLIGCRKAIKRERVSNYQVKTDNKITKKEESHAIRDLESVKINKKSLTGSEIFRRYEKAVFMVFTSDGTKNYQGSGFFIGENGLAVSNYHVFEGTNIGREYIKLANNNETLYKITDVVYKSRKPDIIIFHVNYNNSIYIPIAKEKPSIGDKVFTIGSPRGLENTFSSGEVSQWRGEFLMQISALIDHGSSGGALINEYGESIGITSGSFYDGSQANLNYAWSIEAVKGNL